ncbi:hypothetical protein T265_06641 [Opisthorchis viverrini]|uniref:Secreted protein n=1 Tax=Opisthorchis viverrini TaxID=6198 RepID=A0A075ADD8_OPIVI|nr:hypothetical protein T265_06641 [Opisthorchis viverrini]KER26004.1 hypothetical protein T265_06641 [Opisthorchis viverrini]
MTSFTLTVVSIIFFSELKLALDTSFSGQSGTLKLTFGISVLHMIKRDIKAETVAVICIPTRGENTDTASCARIYKVGNSGRMGTSVQCETPGFSSEVNRRKVSFSNFTRSAFKSGTNRFTYEATCCITAPTAVEDVGRQTGMTKSQHFKAR